MNSVTAKAFAAANSDKVVITFNRNVFTTTTGTLLSVGSNATNGDFDDYFTVKKKDTNTELTVKSSYPYAVDNANDTFSILLNSDIKIGDVLTVGLKPGKTLYDLNGNPITGVTMDVSVASDDNSFLTPTATLASNKITLQFAPAGDVDSNTVDASDFSVSGYTINSFSKSGDVVVLTLNSNPLPGDSFI